MKIMETIHTVYLGDLRTEATHLKSGKKVITDVPAENGGLGEGFSPTDLFCASLVSSMVSVMAGIVKSPGFNGNIDGLKIRTTKIMKKNPHSVEEIIIEFDMPNNHYTVEQKKMLESAVLRSQVGSSIKSDLKQSLVFNY